MKKEQISNTYANLEVMTVAPRHTDKNRTRASIAKSGKDMRGGKK